ncbi:hypothetical protein HK101_004859 [Irineochytrium annulatum]|nr:hypothetical protein HK101_004859 [Irineochytrium annulatum]
MVKPSDLKPVDPDGWQVDDPIQPDPIPESNAVLRRGGSMAAKRGNSLTNAIPMVSLPAEPFLMASAAAERDDLSMASVGDIESGGGSRGSVEVDREEEDSEEDAKPKEAPEAYRRSVRSLTSTNTLDNSSSIRAPTGVTTQRSLYTSPGLLAPSFRSSPSIGTVSMNPSTVLASAGESGRPIVVSLNGVEMEVEEGLAVTLGLLLGPDTGVNHFLYVNDVFAPMKRDGASEAGLVFEEGMKLKTVAYPSLKPLDIIYWYIMRTFPTYHEVSRALSSPWGLTWWSSFSVLLTSALARPLIQLTNSDPTVLVITVISAARIVDTILSNTIYRLMLEGKLRVGMLLVALMAAQLGAMVAGSIPLKCLGLMEYRLVPELLALWFVVFPAIHAGWIALGVESRARPKGGEAGWDLILAFAVVVPVLGLVAGFFVDFDLRWRIGYVNPLTCEPWRG